LVDCSRSGRAVTAPWQRPPCRAHRRESPQTVVGLVGRQRVCGSQLDCPDFRWWQPIVIYSVVSSPASPCLRPARIARPTVTNCVVSDSSTMSTTLHGPRVNSVGAGLSRRHRTPMRHGSTTARDHALSGISWQDAKLHADYEEQGATLALEPDALRPSSSTNGQRGGHCSSGQNGLGMETIEVSTVTAADESKHGLRL